MLDFSVHHRDLLDAREGSCVVIWAKANSNEATREAWGIGAYLKLMRSWYCCADNFAGEAAGLNKVL